MAIERRVIHPALYTLSASELLPQPEEERLLEQVQHMRWFSMKELHTTCTNLIGIEALKQHLRGRKIDWKFEPRNYKLFSLSPGYDNRKVDEPMDEKLLKQTWFVNNDVPWLVVDNPFDDCPFENQNLYIPASWGNKILIAVKAGICKLRWENKGYGYLIGEHYTHDRNREYDFTEMHRGERYGGERYREG